jgi:hypothetical protein
MGVKMVRKPNFFIIGAPKCGTTAMSEYLRSHPNVFMSDPKEPCFFSKDVVPSNYQTIDEYLELFAHAKPQHSVVAEASIRYIHSKYALDAIRKFQPDAKLMVMLRCPTDLVYAYHGQMLKQGDELEQDFEKAWGLQSARATGKALSQRGKYGYGLLQYKWIGSLGSQIENVLRIFPKDQVHVTFFEDMVADTGREYRRLLSFLELPDDGRKEFPRINEATAYKWLWLGQFPKRLRSHIAGLLHTLHRRTGFRGTGLLKILDHFNVETRPRPPLRPEFRYHLDEVFMEEVMLLEELLGQELPAWHGEVPERFKL